MKFLRKLRKEETLNESPSFVCEGVKNEFVSLNDLLSIDELEDRIFETTIQDSDEVSKQKFQYVQIKINRLSTDEGYFEILI